MHDPADALRLGSSQIADCKNTIAGELLSMRPSNIQKIGYRERIDLFLFVLVPKLTNCVVRSKVTSQLGIGEIFSDADGYGEAELLP
jgi:hypothetical protein